MKLQLIVASAAIALPAPASAVTPSQCSALRTLIIKALEYQLAASEQGMILAKQGVAIDANVFSLMMTYPELKDADFVDLKRVGERVGNASLALHVDADMMKAHDDALAALRELCP